MWLQVPSVALALLAATTSASNPLEQQTAQHRGLEAEGFGFSSHKSCECKSGQRKCLFFHGELHSEKNDDLETKSKYFGDMEDHAPCCSSIKYASLDTMNTPWTDEELQETVCDHALSMSKKSDVEEKIIKNTILVTHSMGALILAGAVANGKCSIDNSTSWVSMSAPMLGTMASDTAQDACSKENWEVFRDALSLVGKCPVKKGMKSLAYMGADHATKKLNKAYKKAQDAYREFVTAAMCSNGYSGIFSVHQAKYITLANYIDHGVGTSDGFVTYESCRGGWPKSKFGNEPTDPFYVSKCNHADTKFLHGNDPFKDNKKPVRWFECAL